MNWEPFTYNNSSQNYQRIYTKVNFNREKPPAKPIKECHFQESHVFGVRTDGSHCKACACCSLVLYASYSLSHSLFSSFCFPFSKMMRTTCSIWKHFHTTSYSEGEKCDLQILSNETGISKCCYYVQTHPCVSEVSCRCLFCFVLFKKSPMAANEKHEKVQEACKLVPQLLPQTDRKTYLLPLYD